MAGPPSRLQTICTERHYFHDCSPHDTRKIGRRNVGLRDGTLPAKMRSGHLIDEGGNGTQHLATAIEHKAEMLAQKLAVLVARPSEYEGEFICDGFTTIVVPLYRWAMNM